VHIPNLQAHHCAGTLCCQIHRTERDFIEQAVQDSHRHDHGTDRRALPPHLRGHTESPACIRRVSGQTSGLRGEKGGETLNRGSPTMREPFNGSPYRHLRMLEISVLLK